MPRPFAAAACAALVLALPAVPGHVGAQEPGTEAMLARIREEGLERSHVLATFNTITNVIGPRLTGSPAFKRAADWARSQLESYDLENAHLESWEFGRGWTLKGLTLEMTAPRYFPLIGYPEAWTPSTDGTITGTPVYVGDLTADQVRALGARLKGAIVLPVPPQSEFLEADRPQPTASDERARIGAPRSVRSEGKVSLRDLLPLLQQAGAAAVLRPNQGKHGTLFVLGHANTPDDAVPSVILAAEHYNMIVRLLQAGEPVELRVNVSAHYDEADTNGYNVLAEIPGTDPALREEVVLVGAHLDSWHSATGGTDNGDADAAALEAMRILEAVGAHPKRTIRVALWGGEEEGLLGSRAYVRQHFEGDANRAARDHVYVYLNDDPGTGPTYGFYLEENEAVKPVFDAWLAPFLDLGARRNVLDGIGSTDHLSFIRAGIPGFNTIKSYEDYDVRTHHTNMDFYERVSEQDLKESAIVLAGIAYQAAMRPGPLPGGRPTPEPDRR